MTDSALYQQVTELFRLEMIRQLEANSRKGNREGWMACAPMQLVLEIYYHTGKLQAAVKDGNEPLIREYSADVANMAMMVLDRCGGLLTCEVNPIVLPRNEWTTNIIKDE